MSALTRRTFVKDASIFALGASVGASALISGCTTSEGNPSDQSNGDVVSATVPGFNGDVTVSMSVNKEDGTIENVSIEGAYETADRGGMAIAKMQEAMNQSQSIDADTVTGATVTSTAILDAAAHAYAQATGTSNGNIAMTPGVYEAEAWGHYPGIPIKVSVTLGESSIEDIEVSEDNLETELMIRAVKEKYIPRILEQQALSIDAITGATMSSSAVRLAVEQCVKDAYSASDGGIDAVYPWLRKAEYDSQETESMEADVVVIGLGGSGIATALSAAENGLSVIAVEKAGKYGGTTCVTSESFAVNPSRFQKEKNKNQNFVDAAALKKDWYARTHEDAKEELLDLFLRESGETIDWLNYEHDWPYNMPNPGHVDYATYDCCFTYDPYTLAGPKKELAERIDGLMQQYEALGGKYLLETEVTDFIYNDTGTVVTGVNATGHDGKLYEIAAKAVVMATGGFGENQTLMDKYMIDDYFPLSGKWHLYGMATNDGAMIQKALDMGAGDYNPSVPPLSHLAGFPINLTGFGTQEKDEVSFFTGYTAIWSEGDIPSTLSVAADSLAVTRDGKRFMNEEEFATHGAIKAGPEYFTIWSQEQLDTFKQIGLDYADPGPSMGYVGCQSTIPLDEPLDQIEEVIEAAIDTGYVHRADSIEALAEAIGADPTTLAETVESYNLCCESGKDDEFGKDAQYLEKIGQGPYYAILGCAFYYTTGGALDVNENMQVLTKDGTTPIDGLYAVGTDSMGVLMTNQEQYLDYGGAASGWALTSGRLAGIAIAEAIRQ